MSSEWFAAVQATLRGDAAEPGHLGGPHQRLVDAWRESSPDDPGLADLAALINQVLRYESLSTGRLARLDVPMLDPSFRQQLRKAGLDVIPLGADRLRVATGIRWQPQWLHGESSWIDLAISAPNGIYRPEGGFTPSYSRPESTADIDPAVGELTHANSYRSPAQAVAVRTVALARPGSTIHVVLPTGLGKSLVGLAPGLLRAGATTVVIVPTTALALDQERHAHERFPRAELPAELSYYGAPSERNRLIRERLAEGRQRLVFTSPEAFVGGLAMPLHELARRGGLSFVVVDEAHLVRSWGLDFRPEFQLAAALISELGQVARASGHPSPTTVLMTATLSIEDLQLNETLFPGQPPLFVASTFLRTELRYLLGHCNSEEERRDRLTEAMYHLPRPAIVYTTRKDAAEHLVARMRWAGFRRVVAFHGDTQDTERLAILRDWSGTQGATAIDVVVGTSAFGLGVDQADVRSVVHACVPSSVDRFYQEVGRAGRDGHAAVSLWLPVREADLAEARRIEGATVIGDDKAWFRWQAMRASAEPAENGSLIMDTSAVPSHVPVGSDFNRLWNRNTLTLLERAGILEIGRCPPPLLVRDPSESNSEWEARKKSSWAHFRDHLSVRVASDLADGLTHTAFRNAITKVRSAVLNTQRSSIANVEHMLDCESCWSDIFAGEYAFEHDMGSGTVARQKVSASCSGCPGKRHHGSLDGVAPLPIIPFPSMPMLDRQLLPTLGRELHGRGALVVTYETTDRGFGIGPWLDDLVRRSVANGVRQLIVPASLRDHPAVRRVHRHAQEGLVVVESNVRGPRPFAVPTLLVLTRGDSLDAGWLPPVARGQARIICIPEDALDPAKPGVRVAEWRSPVLAVDELLRRI